VHRSETSIGAGISLILMSVYYFLTTLGEAFQYKINMHPWVLMWIPNIFLLVIGTRLVYKLFQK
jgi:lipopolysaccharide export LptBFGC system permease protein LptF